MVEEGDPRDERTSDQDTIGRMKEKGVPPKEIDDALNRQKIKSAVSADVGGNEEMEASIMMPERPMPGGNEEMEASIMMPERPMPLPTEGGALKEEDLAPPHIMSRERDSSPRTMEVGEEEYVPKPQEETYAPSQRYSVPQEYAPQEYYDEYTPSVGGITDADTMIEISEQVFSEKIKHIQKQVEEMNEFRTLAETKIEHISAGLKRIETVIDRLQAAILEKVGAYGRGVEGIKKEMSMMQESFGKMVGSMAKQHHTTRHTTKKTAHKTVKKTSRKR
jgi:hypothetical protein